MYQIGSASFDTDAPQYDHGRATPDAAAGPRSTAGVGLMAALPPAAVATLATPLAAVVVAAVLAAVLWWDLREGDPGSGGSLGPPRTSAVRTYR
jgi:hypothetical protein